MIGAKSLRGLVAAVCLLVPSVAFAINSNGSGGGNWNSTATWSGGVVPAGADDVVIVGNDTVTVTDTRSAASITFNSGSGSRTLRVSTGGDLTVTGTVIAT